MGGRTRAGDQPGAYKGGKFMWLNMAQARRRLGVSQGDLARLVQDGKVEMVIYYGHRRYSEESIDRCVEEHRYKPRREISPGVEYIPGMKIV